MKHFILILSLIVLLPSAVKAAQGSRSKLANKPEGVLLSSKLDRRWITEEASSESVNWQSMFSHELTVRERETLDSFKMQGFAQELCLRLLIYSKGWEPSCCHKLQGLPVHTDH